tara:strand:- start:4004 stop:4306 length:303 start_codon:yes stop_codon:yes gene_type:complete
MTHLTECLGLVAPYYNMVLVAVVVILFIIFLRRQDLTISKKPWKLLFGAILIYIVEEFLTVTKISEIGNMYKILHPLLEMGIIALFIYVLLLQREYLKSK